jgi:hypothetical protein
MTTLTIGEQPLTLAQLRAVLDGPTTVSITPAAWADVDRGAAVIAAIVAEGRTVYGVNTGSASWPTPPSRPAIWRPCSAIWCSATPVASAPCCRTP